MKKSLTHLPAIKRDELVEIVALICKICRAEMIILFGSYARGDWIETYYTDPDDNRISIKKAS